MSFVNAEVESNYRRLGFVPEDLRMKLKVGQVELGAIESPLAGVALSFTCVGKRAVAQFEINLPICCSTELIAGMIYANIAKCFSEDAPTWKRYLQNRNIPLFQ